VAPSRDQMRRWQQQVAPGKGLRARFDRGAWTAAGQSDPSRFDWSRALMQVALTVALLAALVLVLDADITALIGGTLGYSALIARAHRLHRRFRLAPPRGDRL
jgi:hypothetical protein